MKKVFFITSSILLFLFLVYRFFFVGLMYDAYENSNAEYEDSNVYIDSSFFQVMIMKAILFFLFIIVDDIIFNLKYKANLGKL